MSTDVEVGSFQEQLDLLEVQIERLCDSASTREGFYREFLEKSMAVLGVGGAVWQVGDAGRLDEGAHMNLAVAGLDEQGAQYPLLQMALERVGQTLAAVVLPGSDGSNMYDGGLGKDAVNRTAHTLLFLPIVDGDKLESIFLLISPAEVDPRAVRGFLEFLVKLCRKAGLFLLRMRLEDLESQQQRAGRLREYVSALHSGLDPRRTCYALANYAQELLGVYRCMAGTFDSRGKFRLLSVSGLESVAVKSSFVKSISRIARRVCRNEKILQVDNPNAALSETPDAADNLVTDARVYMLQAQSVVMGVFPIQWDKKVVGALVVEKAHEIPIELDQRRQIEALLVEAGSALSNSLTYRNLPFSPLVRALGALRDRVYRMNWRRRLFWAVFWVSVAMAPFVVPKEIKVIGTAQLEPIHAAKVFARQRGVIALVNVHQGDAVTKGQVLATMEMEKIEGELDLVFEEISTTNTRMRISVGLPKVVAFHQAELSVLRERQKLLWNRKKDYVIRAPVDGIIVTPESKIRHLARPVERGEELLGVVPLDTTWEISVLVPEDEAGDMLEAWDALAPGEFLWANVKLKAYPRETFRSQVISVSPRAFVETTGEQKHRNVIEVRVAEPEGFGDKIDPRQGFEGKVAIECGRGSLFYAATHEFVDFLRVSFF